MKMMLLGLVFLADVASPGSCLCNRSSEEEEGVPVPEYTVTISIPSCSCFKDNAAWVYVYNGEAGDSEHYNPSFQTIEIFCNQKLSGDVQVKEGLHEIQALTSKGTYASRVIEVVPDGGPREVNLTCP